MLDVVEAVEGPIIVNRCLYSPEECNKFFSRQCPVHDVLFKLQKSMEEYLAAYNFQMLRERVK
jgi:DNA-binding IscR family transcriptional regulator